MRKLKFLIHILLLITTPMLFAFLRCNSCFPNSIKSPFEHSTPHEDFCSLTYDQITNLLEEIESGEIEKTRSPQQLEQINQFFALLAKEGILPNDSEEEASITEDIEELLEYRENPLQYTFALGESQKCLVIPAIFTADTYGTVLECSWVKKRWKNTKAFIKKHKKAIIIGAIIIVTATAITIAIIASSSSAVSAVSSAAAVGASESNSESDSSPSNSLNSVAEDVVPLGSVFQSTMKEEIDVFKERIADENFLSTSSNDDDLSIESKGKIIGSLWAHQTFEEFHNNIKNSPTLAQEIEEIKAHIYLPLPLNNNVNQEELGHREIDRRFSIDYDCPHSYFEKDSNDKILPYQIQAEKDLAFGRYPEAISNLNQAITIDPSDSTLYLKRAVSHFHMEQYDQSLQDFQKFTTDIDQTPHENPLSISEFSVGFAKGLPQGVYESGKGILVFLSDFIVSPVHTSARVVQSFSRLAELVQKDEWDILGKAVAPEVYELVKEWNTLPSDKKGELAGYAIGKHGTDIFAPGTLAKVASKSIKNAKELAAVYKNIKLANESLILETAAGIENVAKIGEIVTTGKTVFALGKSLGFTESEMVHLRKSGILENSINKNLDKLASKFENKVIKDSIRQHRHIKVIRENFENPVKEIQKSICSYEKLIVKHKDKIRNPKKNCPDWENLHPKRKSNLINKHWPKEIESYQNKKDILEAILQERRN